MLTFLLLFLLVLASFAYGFLEGHRHGFLKGVRAAREERSAYFTPPSVYEAVSGSGSCLDPVLQNPPMKERP